MDVNTMTRKLRPIIGHTIAGISAAWLADSAINRHVGHTITAVRYLRPAERTKPAQNILIATDALSLDETPGLRLSAAAIDMIWYDDEPSPDGTLAVLLTTYHDGDLELRVRPNQSTPGRPHLATNHPKTDRESTTNPGIRQAGVEGFGGPTPRSPRPAKTAESRTDTSALDQGRAQTCQDCRLFQFCQDNNGVTAWQRDCFYAPSQFRTVW